MKLDHRGASLVEVMVSGALIATSAIAISSLIVYNRTGEARIKRWTQAEQSMVLAASQLQAMRFRKLHEFCVAKGALNTPRSGICTTPNGKSLANTPALQTAIDPVDGEPKVLEVLRNWNGDRSPTGSVCIELAECQELAAAQMLQVTLRGFWLDARAAGANEISYPRQLVFRKAR